MLWLKFVTAVLNVLGVSLDSNVIKSSVLKLVGLRVKNRI